MSEPTVCLTFDVDAEAGLGADYAAAAGRLSTLSEARFGVVRGLPRILDLLRDLELTATFYVPGATVERHRERIAAIVEAGHEVGHHGHHHLRDTDLDSRGRRAEIEDGLAALRLIGVVPEGYRSPAWELTTETLELLREHGFRYDSSCMGDDRPYFEGEMLELPVHWSLDDWPFFGFGSARAGDPDAWRRTWAAELDDAWEERRLVTLTMHPEIIGRGYRLLALAELLRDARERGFRFARHGDVARALT